MPERSDASFRAARPTIQVAGQDNSALAAGLLTLLIVENISGLYRCEATFGNWVDAGGGTGFLYFDRRTLDFGKDFKVKLGADTIFEGRIMGLEAQFPEGGAPELTALAEDRFQDLRMTRRTRTFEDVTDAGVIRQVANEHGLSPEVSVTGPSHRVLAQTNQSDLAFLRERARTIDAELWMEGATLNAKSHSDRDGAAAVQMTLGNKLREFSVLADLAHQRTSVTVSGWDVAAKSEIKYEAAESVISGELNGDLSGVSILGSALGSRKEAVAHTVPLTSQEAQAAAETYFKFSARRFVVGRGMAETDSRLRVGGHVE